MAHFHAVEERPVVLVAIVQVNDDFHAARVDAAQAAHGLGEVTVGAWIVHRPVGAAVSPGAGDLEAAVDAAHRRIHQAAEGPFAGLLEIARDGIVIVPFHRRILAKRALKCEHGGDHRQHCHGDGSGPAEADWKVHVVAHGVTHVVTHRILRGLVRADRVEKPPAWPAFRPAGKLKHAPPKASVFHELSRAVGPFKQDRKTTGIPNVPTMRGRLATWLTTCPARSQLPASVPTQFFMRFRGPQAHLNRPRKAMACPTCSVLRSWA